MVGNHITIDNPPSVLDRPPTNGISGDYNKTESANSVLVVNGNHIGLGSPKLVIFSSQDEKGTARQATQFSDFAEHSAPDLDAHYLEDLSFTLNHKRSSLPWKSFAVLGATEDLKDLGTSVSSAQRSISNPSLGFVFTGQGGQWAQMGKELVSYPVFDRRLKEAEDYLLELGCPWNLREEMFKPQSESNINKPNLSQPLCTALQIALVDLLSSFGVHPTAVVGHSSGEIAAAYAAGAMSAKSAWSVAYYRGICAAKVVKIRTGTRSGAMMAVGLSQESAKPYLERVAKQFGVRGLTIACINSPKNVTISGDAEQIDTLKQFLDVDKVFARRLMVDVAYHSPHMKEISQEYFDLINGIEKDSECHREAIMISSVTGERVSPDILLQPDYWVSNMVSPVKFVDAVGHLFSRSARRIRKKLDLSHRDHFNINWLVEVGPHAALQGPVRDILTELPSVTNIGYSSVIMRKQTAVSSMITAMGQVKCLGYPVDLDKINYPKGKSSRRPMILPDLPSYPFDHSKGYWFESRLGNHFRTFPQNKLDLLGKPVADWNPLEAKWRNVIRVSEMPWVEDHVVSQFSNNRLLRVR
jgi:acyl transferase domain-containing protein